MAHGSILDFEAQAEQLMRIIEPQLASGNRDAAKKLVELKLKSIFEQGVSSGRLYEREGVYPFLSVDD